MPSFFQFASLTPMQCIGKFSSLKFILHASDGYGRGYVSFAHCLLYFDKTLYCLLKLRQVYEGFVSFFFQVQNDQCQKETDSSSSIWPVATVDSKWGEAEVGLFTVLSFLYL